MTEVHAAFEYQQDTGLFRDAILTSLLCITVMQSYLLILHRETMDNVHMLT